MFDELVARQVQDTEHAFLYKACAHNLFLSRELRSFFFAHAIIHPVVSCNCLFPLFYVAHEFPEAGATSELL